MSGGSFDYACHDTWDLGKAEALLGKLENMRGRILTKYPDAVPHINEMVDFIEEIRDEYYERGRKIFDLLEAIEWYYSGDRGPEGIGEALAAMEKKKNDQVEL